MRWEYWVVVGILAFPAWTFMAHVTGTVLQREFCDAPKGEYTFSWCKKPAGGHSWTECREGVKVWGWFWPPTFVVGTAITLVLGAFIAVAAVLYVVGRVAWNLGVKSLARVLARGARLTGAAGGAVGGKIADLDDKLTELVP